MGQHDLTGTPAPARWAAVAAQVTGPAHAQAGGECEDSFAAASTADGEHCFLVVADGAGSAARASTGSRLAARAALHALLLHAPQAPADWETVARAVFTTARDALVLAAAAAGGELRALHTTLLVAGVVQVGDERRLVAAGIGDGAIVVGDASGFRAVAVTPRGEYANETVFLTDGRFADRIALHVESAPDLRALAVMSDGVEALAVEGRGTRPVAGFFGKLVDHLAEGGDPQAISQVLSSDRAALQSDDDKTLLMLVPDRRTEP